MKCDIESVLRFRPSGRLVDREYIVVADFTSGSTPEESQYRIHRYDTDYTFKTEQNLSAERFNIFLNRGKFEILDEEDQEELKEEFRRVNGPHGIF